MRAGLIYVYKQNYLEGSWATCPFSKATVAGSHQGSEVPLAVDDDLLSSNRCEFRPVEQVLGPIRKQVTSVSVFATTCQASIVVCMVCCWLSLDMTILLPAACIVSWNARKLLSQFQCDFCINLSGMVKSWWKLKIVRHEWRGEAGGMNVAGSGSDFWLLNSPLCKGCWVWVMTWMMG